uniref:immunoglobulin-like domain-containing protein n=1 Tax=Yoonia sp. TaxID=2212373 RepID=UPI00404818C8
SDSNAANTGTLTVAVVDADENAPVITTSSIVSSINEGATALGSVTANETVTWSISGSGVSISSSGVVTLDSAADYETATSHSFTITATDSDSNAANTGTLTVAVVDADENAPVITLVGNAMIMHPLGLIYTDAGATASDDVDGNIEVATSGNVDVTLPGVYIITYSATDSAGNQAIELERIVTVSDITYSLDLDGNGQYDALTDGLLLLRGMFGLDGSALVTGTIAPDAAYTESVDIESRIATLGDLADIDGNGEIDALTDGLLTLRYLFGLQGDTLINGVVAGDATRKTAEEIEAHLETLMPAL